MWLKRWLLGHPLKTSQATHERLSNPVALAVFSWDPLSSVAYATEDAVGHGDDGVEVPARDGSEGKDERN